MYTKYPLNNLAGKHFPESWYTHVIDLDSDGFYLDSMGQKRILFKFRKSVINNKVSELAINCFLKFSKLKHSNRGIASGIGPGQTTARTITKTGQNEGKYTSSNISGYFDRPLREHRGPLGTIVACRTTAFTLKNKDLWESGLPFIKLCSNLFKKYSPKEWNIQKKEFDLIHNDLKIPDTVFSTVTSNYNWRTACHCDSGDLPSGLGNLIVVGKSFEGGYLGFPEFKVLVKIKPGDFLLMDSHQFHCNTPIKTSGDGFRLSFVMYIRQDMSKCKKIKLIDKIKYRI